MKRFVVAFLPEGDTEIHLEILEAESALDAICESDYVAGELGLGGLDDDDQPIDMESMLEYAGGLGCGLGVLELSK